MEYDKNPLQSFKKYPMNCHQCGKPWQPDFRFCPYCGVKIEWIEDIKDQLRKADFGGVNLFFLPVERSLNEQEKTIFSHFLSGNNRTVHCGSGDNYVCARYENHCETWGSVDDWSGSEGETCIAMVYKITDTVASAAEKKLTSAAVGGHFADFIERFENCVPFCAERKYDEREVLEVPEALKGIVGKQYITDRKTITHFVIAKDPLGFNGSYAVSIAYCYEKSKDTEYTCSYS